MCVPLVVKFGGSTFEPSSLAPFAQAVARATEERSVAVVHGGGKDVTSTLEALGIEAPFVDGLRVTSDAALSVVEQVLSGKVNKALVRALLAAHVPALGLSGTDAGILKAEVLERAVVHANGTVSKQTWGRVGEVRQVDATLLRYLWTADYVPVLSPLALGPDGGALNVNADTAAAAIAGALDAELLFLTDVPGLLGADGALVAEATRADLDHLKQKGVVRGGFLPKVEACLTALSHGAPSAFIQSLPAFTSGSTVGTRILP